MIYRTREIGTIEYVSGQKKSLEIPRDGVLLALLINLQYTVTNGSSAAVGPLFQTLARLLSRIDLTMAGVDNVVSHSGAMLAARAQYDHGVPCRGMDATVVLTGSGTATTYRVTIPIYRFLPRSTNPLRTADDLRRVNQAVMEVTWGAADTSDFYTTPNDAAISAVTCRIEGQYLVDAPDDYLPQTRVLKEISHSYSASNTDAKVTVDNTTGQLLRSVAVAALRAEIGSASPLAGKIRFEAGPFTFHDRLFDTVIADNRAQFSQESLIVGYHHFPFTNFGDPSLMVNTSPQALSADLEAHFDLTYTSGAERLLLGVETVRNPQI
jgi:hypothetical protein